MLPHRNIHIFSFGEDQIVLKDYLRKLAVAQPV